MERNHRRSIDSIRWQRQLREFARKKGTIEGDGDVAFALQQRPIAENYAGFRLVNQARPALKVWDLRW
jgi:hypothetical protein